MNFKGNKNKHQGTKKIRGTNLSEQKEKKCCTSGNKVELQREQN
jgi:hypothetical protein